MPQIFSDLHCHPTLYAFNRMRNHDEYEDDPDRYHPWYPMPSNPEHMSEGRRASTYTQITVPMMVKSGVRLAYGSITPIEKGFFVGSSERHSEHPFVVELLKLVSGATLARTASKWLTQGGNEAAREAARILKNRGPLRVALQRVFLRYGLKRLRHILSGEYDYWEEFEKEYDFLQRKSGVQASAPVARIGGGEEEVSGTYELVRGAEHLRHMIEETDHAAIVLTIEGAHTFTIGRDLQRLPTATILDRVRYLRQMEHPVLFVTVAHHFDNGICGHAHSIPDAGEWVMDQSPRMNAGFERQDDIGRLVCRELLDLDDKLEPRGGRRIHIDVKHMSPRTRQEYYAEIVEPYNEAHPGDKIPVIISHACHSGVHSLDQLIAEEGFEDDNWHRPPFISWGLNIADEDVHAAFHSRGLIGILFDQRVCGVTNKQQISAEGWIAVVLNHIFRCVDAVMLDSRIPDEDKVRAWDIVCLGTDYDGMIDPLTRYPTSLHLPRFAEDLRAALHTYRHTRRIDEVGVDEIVDKFCWRNGYELALRTLPREADDAS